MSGWSRGHFVADHSAELCLALLEILILVRSFLARLGFNRRRSAPSAKSFSRHRNQPATAILW
jgi:hypothetical protein